MNMFRNGIIATALAVAFAGVGHAADSAMTKDQYKAEKDRIGVDAKSAKDRCKSAAGNAKDICMAEAKGQEKVAKAELELRYKNTGKARNDVRLAKADANYEVAKEKCDALAGAAKDRCVPDAKAKYGRS